MNCFNVSDNKVKGHLKKILILDAFPLSENLEISNFIFCLCLYFCVYKHLLSVCM